MARFRLELANLAIPFVFLDLDRPHLDPRRPTTLLAEAARQLQGAIAVGRGRGAKAAEDLDAINRNIGVTHEARSISREGLHNVIEAFCAFAHANTSRNLPFIIDTFEIAQSLGDAPVYLVREMLTQLQHGIPNLRPIISGRVLPDPKKFWTDPCRWSNSIFHPPSAS